LTQKNRKRASIWIIAAVLIIAVCIGGSAVYLSDYYHADYEAIEAFAAGNPAVKTEISDGIIAYGNKDSDVGFIFYPGGKVEYTAYEPLMRELAADGVLCILIEMPFNLAVLDINAAKGIDRLFPEIESWYIGGHSLGGSMAASYLADNHESFNGLILLGSYSTADLSDTGLVVLSVYGSEDRVLNAEKYEKYKSNLPENLTEKILSGGCHAYFGMYGEQEGDGIPSLTPEEQIELTAAHIADFISEGEE